MTLQELFPLLFDCQRVQIWQDNLLIFDGDHLNYNKNLNAEISKISSSVDNKKSFLLIDVC